MIKGLKICGVSDPETLNFILNHPCPPKFIGFITNYEKSKRFVNLEKLKELINVNKKQVEFVSVLVNPTDEILEKIKNLNFDYYQLYDVDSKGYHKSESFDHNLLDDVPKELNKMIAGNIQISDIPSFKNKDFIIDLSGSIENNEGKKDLNKINKLLNLFVKNEA